MLNGKIYSVRPTDIEGKAYHGDDLNIRCSNGVLHCIDGYLEYLPSLYEYITTSPDYKGILGDWYKSFTVAELDPYESVAGGLNENGEIWYVDSVTHENSILMNKYGRIISEDSTYAVVLPSPTLWDTVYNSIAKSFVYEPHRFKNPVCSQRLGFPGVVCKEQLGREQLRPPFLVAEEIAAEQLHGEQCLSD